MTEKQDPLVGKTLGGYLLQAAVYRGPTGRIYRARQVTVERDVALKIPSAELSRDPEFVSLFLSETRSAAKLGHASIVQIYDVCQRRQVIFYSMEYLAGGSLASRVKRDGPLPWRSFVPQLTGVADALLHGEGHGVVHCDVNPTHLLLTQDGRMKVLNLGLGLGLRRSRDPTLKPPLASLPFLAPEQIVEGGAEHRSDIYALGCTAFFALCGKLPFRGETAKEIFSAKMLREPPALSEEIPDVPPWLSSLIGRMVVRDPDQRPQSFREVVDELNEHAPEGGRPGRAPTVSRLEKESAPQSFVSSAAGKLTIAGVAVLLIAIVGFVVTRGGGDDPSVARDDSRDDSSRRAATRWDPGGASSRESDDGSGSDALRRRRERRASHLAGEPAGTGDAGTTALDGASSRALEELARVRSQWRTELPSYRDAREIIEKLKKDHVHPEVARQAEEVWQSFLALDALREFTGHVKKNVTPRIAAGQYREALTRIEAARRKYPQRSSELDLQVRQIEKKGEAEFAELESKVGELIREGRLSRPIELLTDLRGRLPTTLAARATRKIEELVAAKDSVAEAGKQLERLEDRFHDELARSRFGVAAELLAELPESRHPFHVARRGELQSELDACRTVWEKLVAGLEKSRQEARKDTEWQVSPLTVARKRLTGRLAKFDVRKDGTVALTIEGTKGKRRTCGLFDLDDDDLFGLIEKGSEGEIGTEGVQARTTVEGLGLLLSYQQGAKRAWKCLTSHRSIPNARRKRHSARLLEVARTRFDAEIAAIEERVTALAGGPAPSSSDDRKVLVDFIEQVVARHRGFPHYDGQRAMLSKLHGVVAAETMRAQGVRRLFKGKYKEKRGGKVELTYDFSDASQLEDFEIVKGSLELEGKTLRLEGECRMLTGNPFRGSLRVTADCVAYSAASPNINIALWTHPGDVAVRKYTRSSTSTAEDAVLPSEEGPLGSKGYLAFCVGYKPSDDRYSPSLYVLDTRWVVPLPAYAIIGAAHGKTLHSANGYYQMDCIWGESCLNKVRGRQVIKLAHGPSEFAWTVNGKHMITPKNRKKSPDLKRRLEKRGAKGSISLFTYRGSLNFARLFVESEIDPAWFEGEIERRAAVAFAEMEARYVLVGR